MRSSPARESSFCRTCQQVLHAGPSSPRFTRSCGSEDRKSTRLNSSHTVIYTLSLHDALPILDAFVARARELVLPNLPAGVACRTFVAEVHAVLRERRSEEHTSELQSHSDLHSFPTRRSSDLRCVRRPRERARSAEPASRCCMPDLRRRGSRGPAGA